MVTALLSSALLCSVTALSCPESKTASSSQPAVQSVSYDGGSPCGGEKAAVQSVAMTGEKKGGDCALACGGDKGADVQSVAMTSADGKSGECATPCSDKKGFATPAMAFRVGGETVACPVSAKSMAEKSNAKMEYVVEGVAYTTEAEAKVAHQVAMRNFTESLTRVTLVVNGEKVACAEKAAACATACDSTKIQYQVGPAMFDNAEDAVRAAAAAYAAMQNVAMTYEVNGEKTACSTDAAKNAKACGGSVQYVVNGQNTPCSKTADYMLTREQMAAAVDAVQKTIG